MIHASLCTRALRPWDVAPTPVPVIVQVSCRGTSLKHFTVQKCPRSLVFYFHKSAPSESSVRFSIITPRPLSASPSLTPPQCPLLHH